MSTNNCHPSDGPPCKDPGKSPHMKFIKRVIGGVPVSGVLAELDVWASAVGAVGGVAAVGLLHLPRGGRRRRAAGAAEAATEAAAEAT